MKYNDHRLEDTVPSTVLGYKSFFIVCKKLRSNPDLPSDSLAKLIAELNTESGPVAMSTKPNSTALAAVVGLLNNTASLTATVFGIFRLKNKTDLKQTEKVPYMNNHRMGATPGIGTT